MQKLISRFLETLKRHNSRAYQIYSECQPVTSDEMDRRLESNNVVLPTQVRQFYLHLGGVHVEDEHKYDAGHWILPFYYIVSFRSMLDIMKSYKKKPDVPANWDWAFDFPIPYRMPVFPFLDGSDRQYLINPADGKIYKLDPELVDAGLAIYDSLESFLLTTIQMYESGVYFMDENGELDYDTRMYHEIGRRMNSFSNYWEMETYPKRLAN